MINDEQNYRRVVRVKPQRNGDSPERKPNPGNVYKIDESASSQDIYEKEHYDVFCKV